MRAVIYARFSSELQDARSITDQVSFARKYAEGRGLTQVGVYEDAAISGASVINRPGLREAAQYNHWVGLRSPSAIESVKRG